MEGIEFRTTQIRKHKDKARQMAIRAAQEKAIALTKEIGQTIGKAYSITEEGAATVSSSNNFTSNARGSEAEIIPMTKSTIALGQIPVTARSHRQLRAEVSGRKLIYS